MVEEEKFYAWLDGELEPEEAARVEAEVAADPELTRMADEHRAMSAGLRSAFGTVAAAPVPERIANAASAPPGNVMDFSARRERKRVQFGVPQWAAMAATLALGVALGTAINGGRQYGPVEAANGKLYAASAVGRALDTQLASAAAGDVRIGLTFRDRSGTVCRTFESDAASGLACRDRERWRLNGLFAAPEGQGSDYRMAAGSDPRLMDMVDQTISGEPFDAELEKAARAKDWK